MDKKDLEKQIKELEKQNLELRFKIIEQERMKILQEIKQKYPEMLGGNNERQNKDK